MQKQFKWRVLHDYSITIPQYGEIICPAEKRPIVFLTSNNYRELSDALKRRCNYLYINRKTKDEIKNILVLSANIDEQIAESIAQFSISIDTKVKKIPSLSELIEWAKFIKDTNESSTDIAISMLLKDYRDMPVVKKALDKTSSEISEFLK